MMSLSKTEQKLIRSLVTHYLTNRRTFNNFLNSFVPIITGNEQLMKYVHSIKWRTKDGKSLKYKLERKFIGLKEDGKKIDYSEDNLFLKINDLAGFRILYLHTMQFEKINEILIQLFNDERYKLIEGPEARVWDDEYRNHFKKIGIKIKDSGDSLYTSVHYVINTKRQNEFTFEIQVRTLADELWGEVDHMINYPKKSTNLACREQIKVLARTTSSCTRLVDSIFRTHNPKGF